MVSSVLSSAATSSAVRMTSAAPAFSFSRSSLRVPGIGKIQGFFHSIHASEICAGLAFFSSAMRRSSASSSRFWSAASGVNCGILLR